MAGISTPGLGSGLDVNGLVSKLMAVEQQPLTALTTKEASFQAKLTAFGSINGALSALQTAAQTLTSSSTFTGMSVAVADATVLSASADTSAVAGSYAVGVSQLAKYHVISTPSTNQYVTADTFKGGSLDITVGSATKSVTIADGSSLDTIRQAINSANAGVTATVVSSGPPGNYSELVLTSNTSGSVGAISIAVTQTGTGGAPTTPGVVRNLTDFAYSYAPNGAGDTATIEESQAADDAILSVNNVSITRSSNTITDAISGVTLNLVKAGSIASPLTTQLTVSRNTSATKAAIDGFVQTYNAAVKLLDSDTAYNASTKRASILTGDSTVRSIQSQLSNLITNSVGGLAGGISRLSDIGIAVQKDGTLVTNATKLQAALNDPIKDVAGLFTSTSSTNKGVAVRFNELLTGLVGSTGMIATRTDGIQRSIKAIGKQRDALNLRLADIEKRYRAQFAALDALIASMQQTSTYLTQQLASLPGVVSSNSK